MENPARQTMRAMGFVILGIMIGYIPGVIRVLQMQQDAENREVVHLRSVAQLKAQIHDEQMYYLKELHAYRSMAGIRDVSPTGTQAAMGMACAQEFGEMGKAGSGVRSWKPRSDGHCYVEDAQ